MAENPVQFDDFIANVQPDPAKPEATIMLFGYVGHGADGAVRVYPDPTLGTWYDIPAADIVHSMPAPDAKLGGSYVWVRASAEIKPGTTAAAAAAAAPDAGAAPEAAAAPGAAAAPAAPPPFTIGQGCTMICAQPGGGVHPTPTAQPTPATHCFICPPRPIVSEACTIGTSDACTVTGPCCSAFCTPHCQPPAMVSISCTIGTPCHPTFNCSPNCQPAQQPQALAALTQPNCAVLTQQNCQLQTIGAVCTHPLVCQQHPTALPVCPLHTPACHLTLQLVCATNQVACLHITQPNICNIVASPNCPPVGPGTPVQTPQFQQPQAFAAQTLQNCVHTVPAVCPLPTQQNCVHPTFVDCTIIGCPTHLQPCPPPTRPFICTELCPSHVFNCPTQPIVCQHLTQPNICTIVASPNCPPVGPGTPVQTPQIGPQVGQQAAGALQPTPTAQTHCFICPPHTQQPPCQLPTMPTGCGGPACMHTPPAPCPPPPTLPTVCTQPPQCPNPITHVDCTLLPLCQSPPAVCTHVLGCQIHTVQAGCPHPTLAPPCPSVGIACTVVCGSPPQICNIVASPNCPPVGPGTPQQIGPQVGQQAFGALQPTPTVQTRCFVCPPLSQPPQCPHPQTQVSLCTDCTLPPLCQTHTAPTVCTQPAACQIHTAQPPCPSIGIACTVVNCPTARNICSETCQTLPVVCQPQQTHAFPCTETCNTLPVICQQQTLPINCLPQTLPNICNVVASPNCPPVGPGTPVQTPQQQVGQQAFGAMQPTPTVQTRCFICPPLTQACQVNTAATVCTQPPACQPSVHAICPTPSAVQQCGGNTAATVCQPSVHVICPTPSAVHQCGGNTAATVCQPSVHVICPTPSAVHQCGGNTAVTVCQPSVHVICPTPSAVHQCGGNTAATVCQPSVQAICPTPSAVQQCGTLQAQPPSGTMHQCCGVQAGGFPTMQGCPPVTTNCMTMPPACGVFTPFGQQ